MADALPTHQKGDDSSDLASSYEAIALLIHAFLVRLDFRLYGFDEDKSLPECVALAPQLPPQWNSGFGSLSFAYKHKQSSMRFVFRVDRMGARVEIRGLAVGHDRIFRMEEATRNLVDSNKLPVRITMTEEGEDRSDLAEKLGSVFSSDSVATGVLINFQTEILEKLIPKLHKEGYHEIGRTSPLRPHRPPRSPEPANPTPPATSCHLPSPCRFPSPFHRGNFQMPPTRPYGIGHDDLNPSGLGPHDPLRGSFTGGQPPRPGGFAGMHPTFDDPIFTGQGRFGGGGPSPEMPYNPQAPPGARWDPVGPTINPRFFGQGNGRGNNPYGGFGGGGDII
ncbi:hypothetical protein PT974_12137 [Cladobotryum mycophilum]|uniref:Proteasome inhibitor PI31 subunit n=1 Tax=Cladobotryum mycophilum TaxID=491253 RepID=A0ABR0S771_9HYPO